MAVKDKLELERLYAILDDLETMYRNEEVSEETYTEMRKNYKKKISDIQNKIMDLDKGDETQIDLQQVQEAKDRLKETTSEISENVNEILKETMRSLKKQLKSAGFEAKCKTYSKEDRYNVSVAEDEYISVKCHLDWGKIRIVGTERDEVRIVAEKKSRAEVESEGLERIEKIKLNCKSSLDGKKRTIKITPDTPKWSMVDLEIEIPNRDRNNFHIYSERGKITFNNIVCDECDIENENGNIDIRNFKCGSIDVTTETSSINIEELEAKSEVEIYNENGNIKLSNVNAERIKAYTEKGNILAMCTSERGNLKTELGSINYANIEDSPQQLKLASELGSIKIKVNEGKVPWTIQAKVDLGSINNRSSLSSRPDKKRIFESVEGKDIKERISIIATTDLGSIDIEGA